MFFNTLRGSRIEEGVSVSFKAEDQILLTISQLKDKLSGTFNVAGCIKWFSEEKTNNKFGVEKRLRECILFDGEDHIILTMWPDLLNQKYNCQHKKLFWSQINNNTYNNSVGKR